MIRKALFWNFFAQFVSFAVMFGGSVVVARLLSPREMGIYAVAMATTGILQIISAFGVGNYIIRSAELDEATLDTAFTVNAALGVFLAVSIFLLSFVGARFLAEPDVATVMRLLALAPLISIFDFRPSTMLQRELQFKRISIVSMTQAVIGTGVTITAAVLGSSSRSPAFGALAAALAGAIGYSLMGRQHVAWRVAKTGWRPMTAFGLRMMSIGGIANATSRLSEIILGHFLGVAALGLFGRASNLSNLIFQNIYGTASRVIFAKMSSDFRETGELRSTYLRGMRFIVALMGPMLIGLAVLSKPVVQLLYGAQWEAAAVPLSMLMIAQFISLRFAMNWELFVIRNELPAQTRIEFARSLCTLVSRTIGSLFSVTAAAAAAIFDAVFSIGLYLRHVNRLAGTRESELTIVSIEGYVLTLIATLPAVILMIWSGWSPHTPIALVAGSIVLGAALWVAALWHRGHPLFEEFERGWRLVARRWAGADAVGMPPAE